ncbi:MAG: sporulation protein YjcZ [Bacillota bacterium]
MAGVGGGVGNNWAFILFLILILLILGLACFC